MSIVLPGAEESKRFFDNVRLAPVSVANFSGIFAKTARPAAYSAGSQSKPVAGADALLGNENPAIIGFSDNLDADKKQAAADSIHFAERYATAYSNKSLDPVGWHLKYSEAMRHCGWTMTSNRYQEHTSSQVNVTMDSIVMDIIQAVAGRNAPAMLELLLGVFEKLRSDEPLVTLFDRNSQKGADKEFRIVPCIQSPGGTPITAFLAADCQLSTDQGGAWFWKWKVSQLRMKRVATMVELNMRAHDRVRDRIYSSLDKSSDDFFSGIQL